MMASAAIKAGRALNDPSLSEFAIRSLERVALLCYRPGGGMAHYHDGEAQVRGLLDDQIAMAAAQLDAFEATGNIVYEMLAEELALHAVNLMWDGDGGGFFDRTADEAADVGSARRTAQAVRGQLRGSPPSAIGSPAPPASRAIASWPNGRCPPSARAPPARVPWRPTTCSPSGPRPVIDCAFASGG